METIRFSGFTLTSLGLGCARLGSMTGATPAEVEALILHAQNRGVTLFDTASSYGQGDSERMLGRLVGRDDRICLVTKVGKQVPLKARFLQPVKGIVRKLARGSQKMNSSVRRSRGAALPVNFEPAFLAAELLKCHHRTGLSTLSMVMLHSVDAETLARGAAMDVLAKAQTKGDIRLIGASVDDLTSAEATLKDPRIQAVQVPYLPGDTSMANWAARAKAMGKLVIAREIFDGIAALSRENRKAHIARNLQRCLQDPNVGVSLVGTTKVAHFEEILALVTTS